MAHQTPLLHVSTKETEEVDLATPLRKYIQTAYQDDPDRHAAAIATLSRCRQDMRGAGKDTTGRDILYRYYGQLELLDLRFPISENAVKIQFKWYDSFTSKLVSQYSLAYEKASVIFNIGATCSSIAALQNRFEPTGLKLAFNYFQASAGLFQYINDNFLHPPSVDMSRDSIKVLVDLMLAQAQECFIEKVVNIEKKRGALVAKLSAQVSFVYSNVVDGFAAPSLRGQFDRTWVDLVKIKAKHFQAFANYHKSVQMEEANAYGEFVAHAGAADALAREAVRLAGSFMASFPGFSTARESKNSGADDESITSSLANFAVATLTGGMSNNNNNNSSSNSNTSSDAAALLDMTKALAKFAADRYQAATRDNDLIYHASVPSIEALAPIEKLNAVKTTPFSDLCANGQADITQIIGPDIFHALVPLSVHESSSLYSEEKAKLLRGEQERVKTADAELQATFDSLNMVPILDRLKKFLRSMDGVSNKSTSASLSHSGSAGHDGRSVEHVPLPEQLVNVSVSVLSEEQDRSKVDYLTSLIESTRHKCRSALDNLALMLDKEQQECEGLRVKHMDKWTMEPSFHLASGMRQTLRSHREALDKAIETDQSVQKRLQTLGDFLGLFTKPERDVEMVFSRAISDAGASVQKKGDRTVSLMDENVDSGSDGLGVLGEQITIEKIDGILNRLRLLKKERADTIEALKARLHDDDISSLLLLNKGHEKQIFQTELSKFAPLQGKITTNMDAHAMLIQDVVAEFNKLVASSQGMRVLDARERRRADLVREWTQSFETYREVKTALSNGAKFYTDLDRAVESLRVSVTEFVQRRNVEQADLVRKMDAAQADRGQQALRDQLHRLSLSSVSPVSPTGVLPSVGGPNAPVPAPYASQPMLPSVAAGATAAMGAAIVTSAPVGTVASSSFAPHHQPHNAPPVSYAPFPTTTTTTTAAMTTAPQQPPGQQQQVYHNNNAFQPPVSMPQSYPASSYAGYAPRSPYEYNQHPPISQPQTYQHPPQPQQYQPQPQSQHPPQPYQPYMPQPSGFRPPMPMISPSTALPPPVDPPKLPPPVNPPPRPMGAPGPPAYPPYRPPQMPAYQPQPQQPPQMPAYQPPPQQPLSQQQPPQQQQLYYHPQQPGHQPQSQQQYSVPSPAPYGYATPGAQYQQGQLPYQQHGQQGQSPYQQGPQGQQVQQPYSTQYPPPPPQPSFMD